MLKRVERKALFTKITIYLKIRLHEFRLAKGWSDTEISKETGISQNRLSEIKDYEQYGKIVSEKMVTRLLRARILSVADIKKNLNLTREELAYLDSFIIYELDPRLIKAITEMEQEHLADPGKLRPYDLIRAYREGRVKIVKK